MRCLPFPTGFLGGIPGVTRHPANNFPNLGDARQSSAGSHTLFSPYSKLPSKSSHPAHYPALNRATPPVPPADTKSHPGGNSELDEDTIFSEKRSSFYSQSVLPLHLSPLLHPACQRVTTDHVDLIARRAALFLTAFHSR